MLFPPNYKIIGLTEASLKQLKSSRTRFRRCGSPDSVEADYGSDPENDWIEEEEMREVEEVDDWLLQPMPPAPTFKAEDVPPFRLFNTPGSLLYQLLYFLFIYLNLVPPPPSPSPPLATMIPRKSTPRPRWNKSLDYEIQPRGIHHEPDYDDETEYIISPTPGTNQLPIHIPVTTNSTLQKLQLHNKGMLRIYRVPRHTSDRMRFQVDVLKSGLCGDVVRMPVDEDDVVAVWRHGLRLWDFCQNNEVWYLIATNPDIVREVLGRCTYRRPPLLTRSWKSILFTIRRISHMFLPWVSPPRRPINRPRVKTDDYSVLPKPWYEDTVVVNSDSDSDSESDSGSATD